jgi:hypothetical protein
MQKQINEEAKSLANYFKSSNVKIEMQAREPKYQLEKDKEK